MDTRTPNYSESAVKSADSVGHAIRREGHDALGQISESLSNVRSEVESAVPNVVGNAKEMINRGVRSTQKTATRLGHQIGRASDGLAVYVKEEPVKAVLLAAAAGAVMAALLSMLTRARSHRH